MFSYYFYPVTTIFGLTTIFTLIAFSLIIKKAGGEDNKSLARIIIGFSFVWVIFQGYLADKGFYWVNDTSPPRFALVLFPIIVLIVWMFISKKGKKLIDNIPLKAYTYLHIIRIPVEIVLFWLFLKELIPELMTFEGRNYDILAGITAPFIAYMGFKGGKPNKKLLLTWNIICLLLILNIMVNGILSAPSIIQQFAFEQPNIAIFDVPFIWLPAFVVPVVVFGHLVAIRQLTHLP